MVKNIFKTVSEIFRNPLSNKNSMNSSIDAEEAPPIKIKDRDDQKIEPPKSNFDEEPSFIYNLSSKVWKQIVNKPIEVVALGLVGGVTAFSAGYISEMKRTVSIPLAFSEISQLERESQSRDVPFGEVNYYYSALNDGIMKVFECWNKAYVNSGRDMSLFRDELKDELDPQNRNHRYNLSDFIVKSDFSDKSVYLPNLASDAMKKMSELSVIANTLPEVANHFGNSWSEFHLDHYHTEYDTETYTDSNGKTQTRTTTRQVYDYTDHTYTYYPQEGERASLTIDQFVNSMPNIKLNERLVPAKIVQKDNREAILKSRKTRDPKIEIKEEEYLDFAANWAKGATYTANMGQIHSLHGQIISDASTWRDQKSRAHSTFYRTYSRFDSGPIEFQTCERAERDSINIANKSKQIYEGVSHVLLNIPSFNDKIKDFISLPNEVLNSKKGERAGEAIIDDAREMYVLNFRKGFDVSEFRPLMVAMWTTLGLTIGGLAGLGLDGWISSKWGGNNSGDRYQRLYNAPKFRKYYN